MYSQRALHEYTATSVETGSPAELVVKLYEGAMRFLHEAEAALDRRDLQEKANKINRAMRIVQELSNALDSSVAPELTDRLAALYEYAEYEMLQASTFNDARHLSNARRVLERLHGSWKQVATLNPTLPEAAPQPQDTAGPHTGPTSETPDASAPASSPTPSWSDDEAGSGDRTPSLSISA